MCDFSPTYDQPCYALRRTSEGAVTTCECETHIPEEKVGAIPAERQAQYVATCEECGVIGHSVGGTSDVEFAVKQHDDTHTTNWGPARW